MKVFLRIVSDLDKWARGEVARVEKAVSGSLYEATYALYKETRSALARGELGLSPRVPLRYKKESRKAGAKIKGGKAATTPLRPLTPGIIYKVFKDERRSEVGFIGTVGGGGRIAAWAERLAARHVTGYSIQYDDTLREKLHKMGIHLKKTTTSASVPARGPISAAGDKFGAAALEKLADSFYRKMAGERT